MEARSNSSDPRIRELLGMVINELEKQETQ
jgi:hypothetical protein